ncbi:hypothetical protein FFLO_04138 [Filobasidium floriforme]|uniref:Palmitoyltransferase n=1 Tax=Filobasidium floriforme TaxID=5210 RepID=A0A8K0NQ75_9TREE|nr:DHHC palmitoyltransferase-domain-containing protein [Filobasidium floriforme]KAG7531769.1 hypothetical protein FFLO_04138 [Filobasidium floriforme]KAH8089829.1 DHHC palmitoyltransferase-domain-containing protein [Filobasidium floriforme]
MAVFQLVEDLAGKSLLNGTYFCIVCMARKPLRGKHCRLCNRCTGRFDHHCPWIWNCVGYNNHPNFLLFVGSLVIGIITFDILAVIYYGENGPVYQPEKSPYITFCQTLPSVCGAYQTAPYLLAVTLWSTLQLTWTTILLASQAWQVARQMTTLEVSNLGRYGFMGGRGGTSLREQGGAMAALHAHGAPSANRPEHELQADVIDIGAGPGQAGAEEEGLATSDSIGVNESVPFGTSTTRTDSRRLSPSRVSHNPCVALAGGALRYCANGPLLQLLGLDRFTKGAAGRGMRLAEEGGGNPFDMGIVTNCEDFWTRGQALDIDYKELYSIPNEDRYKDLEYLDNLTQYLDNLTQYLNNLTQYLNNLTQYLNNLTQYLNNLTQRT